MSFKMVKNGVPQGNYRATFSKWETLVHAEYGERCRFDFTITDGKHKGSTSCRFTGTKMTPDTALGKFAAGIAGRKIEVDEEFDPDEFLGRDYLIIVGETQGGSTRVETVIQAEV